MSLYATLWQKVLEPRWERGKLLPQLAGFLAQSQYWSPARLADLQWEKLGALLTHARDQVPFYREFFAASQLTVADIVAARDLSPLPVVTRAQLMERPEHFRADPPPPGTFQKVTGGSSGEPLAFLVSGLSDQWRNAVKRRGYAWAGAVNGRHTVLLWGTDIHNPPLKTRLKHKAHLWLLRARHVNNFELTEEKLAGLTRLIDRFRPRVIVAFTSSAEILAHYAVDTAWRPAYPLDAVLVGAEKLHDPARRLMEKALGCPVYESYGSREFMLMGMECHLHRGLHVSAENLFLELVRDGRPAAPGESGQVLVTDLHNYAQPFIRYQNGDLAAWAAGECPCGRGLPCLERVDGRELDLIRGLDGRPLTGAFFPHLMKEYPAVKLFQAVQEAPGRLELRIVPQGELDQAARADILAQIDRVLPGLRVNLREVAELEKNASGKVRVTIGLPGTGL